MPTPVAYFRLTDVTRDLEDHRGQPPDQAESRPLITRWKDSMLGAHSLRPIQGNRRPRLIRDGLEVDGDKWPILYTGEGMTTDLIPPHENKEWTHAVAYLTDSRPGEGYYDPADEDIIEAGWTEQHTEVRDTADGKHLKVRAFYMEPRDRVYAPQIWQNTHVSEWMIYDERVDPKQVVEDLCAKYHIRLII